MDDTYRMDEAGGEDVLSADQEQATEERLKAIYDALSTKRDEWVQHRQESGVERRWRTAQALYEGKDAEVEGGLKDTLRNGPSRKAKTKQRRSRVVVNIVAPKVEAVVARICEILLPVDDKNWGIKPTPNPQMADAARDGGMLMDPATGQDVMPLADAAKGAQEAAKKACEGMSAAIDDVLTECGLNGQERKLIEDMVRLGSGVLKGPRPIRSIASRWDQGPNGFQRTQVSEIKPASERVDPWNIFFDPACGNDHQRGGGVFEKRDVTRRELRALLGIPGYDDTAIAEVLNEEPRAVNCVEGRVNKPAKENGAYELWEYHGEVEERDFDFLRREEDDVPKAKPVERAVLVMVNDRIIGALPSWCEEDWPYDVATYNERDDSPFGDGLPHRLESQQRVVIAAWRQLMDNSGLASGGQIVMLRNAVEPMDGDWQLSPLKAWWGKEDLDDVRKAFTVFEFSAHTEELLKIVEAAMQMADMESSTPLLMQGDQGSAPDNVGGTTLLFNAANSPLRYRVKRFDDNVTRPHLKRYYDWMMNHSKDASIKGDFEIDARGSSVLIERDAQHIAVMNMANLAANPLYAELISMRKAQSLRSIVKAMKLPPEDWVPEDDEIEAMEKQKAEQPPPADPRIEAANIAAQSKQAELADRAAEREFRAEVEAQNAQERQAQTAYNQGREQGEYEIAMTQEQNERDLAFARLAQERDITVQELQQQWGIKVLDIDTKRQLFNAEAALRVKTGQGI